MEIPNKFKPKLGPKAARKPRVKKEKPVQKSAPGQAEQHPTITTKELEPVKQSDAPDIAKIKTPCLMTFFAKKFSGKSSTMRYVLHSLIKDGRFDYGVVISPTGIFNGDWDCIPEQYRHSEFSEDIINNLLNLQKYFISIGQNKNAFLILDDCVGSVNFNSRIWDKLATTAHQYNLTIMITFQRFTKCPPVIRQNSEYVFVLKIIDDPSIQGLYNEFGRCSIIINSLKILS